jgi:hypothetical protein
MQVSVLLLITEFISPRNERRCRDEPQVEASQLQSHCLLLWACGTVWYESEEESEKVRQEVKHPHSVDNFESWHKIAHGGWEDETVMHEDSIEPQPDPVDTIYLPISNYQYYLQGPLNPLVLTYYHDSYTTLTTFAITKYPTNFESYNLFTCK